MRCKKSALCIAAICVAAMWCTKKITPLIIAYNIKFGPVSNFVDHGNMTMTFLVLRQLGTVGSFGSPSPVAPYRAILRYYRCNTPYRAILFKEVSTPQNWCDTPTLVLSFTQALLCDTPFCNLSRDSRVGFWQNGFLFLGRRIFLRIFSPAKGSFPQLD